MQENERAFFRKVKEAAFANPFGQKRPLLNLQLSGMSASTPETVVIEYLLHEISFHLNNVQARLDKRKQLLSREDEHLFRLGRLFYIHYNSNERFDSLITKQINQGNDSCTVDFADDVLQEMESNGFTRDESLRFFALFFQLRRAVCFINKICGKSRCVQQLRQQLWNNIFTFDPELYDRHLWNRMEDFSTILLGETGTGKGMAAAAIGRSGYIPFDDRKKAFAESFTRSFIAVNLSQYSEQLIESELFGHKKGAFTGAVEAHRGVFSRCSPHGAIFLDEIGDTSIAVQIKLLQLLQERRFTPVGGHESRAFSGRVVAATNRPLNEMRQAGKFRDDFYYRLCSDTIEIPPFRQRIQEHPDELRILLSVIVKRILGYREESLAEKIQGLINEQQPSQYQWPGNIRELEQCVRQMFLQRCYSWQEQASKETGLSSLVTDENGTYLTAREVMGRYCLELYERVGSLEKVASLARLDRRTVKKHIDFVR